MRSPLRIKPFLAAIEAAWLADPDQRFGQLVMNLSREPGGFADTWNWENSEWLRRIEDYLRVAAAGERTKGAPE